MNLRSSSNILLLLSAFWLLSCSSHQKGTVFLPQDRVMSIEEFKQAIDNYELFKRIGKTTKEQPLDKYEIIMIENAKKVENIHLGGVFQPGREISTFLGDTLLVEAGKKKGKDGANQGKAVLLDYIHEENEINNLIKNLHSNKWLEDPYTGKKLPTISQRESYIKELERKKQIYRKAFKQKNQDILNRYYTVNIKKDVQPDMLAFIASEADMAKVPDNKFMNIEFEDVPCHIFLNPKLYKILERITKPHGSIKLSVTNACRRLIAPVLQSTTFGEQFETELEKKYCLLDSLHPTYHRLTFTLTNKNK